MPRTADRSSPQPTLRRRLKDTLKDAPLPARGPLLRWGWRAWEASLGFSARGQGPSSEDGLAIPPPRLRVLVLGSADPEIFLEGGRAQAELIRELLGRNGADPAQVGSILDFGCGCGRILRWWRELEGVEIYGCDLNPELARWCDRNLPFVEARPNGLEPPLPFAAERPFGFIYANSVFTHLPEPLQRLWLAEIHSALAPGGLFAFTVSGDHYRDRLTGAELEAYERGELVTHFPEAPGANLCATFHPPAYVEREMLVDFELLDVERRGAIHLGQDMYLARRPAGVMAERAQPKADP